MVARRRLLAASTAGLLSKRFLIVLKSLSGVMI
jgi:hypothetical protein